MIGRRGFGVKASAGAEPSPPASNGGDGMRVKALFQTVKQFVASHALHAQALLLVILVAVGLFVLRDFADTTDYFIESNEKNMREKLKNTASGLALLVTAEELDTYREPADMELPGYQALKQKLVKFADEANVRYAYYLRVVGDELQYIVDNDFDEDSRVGLDSRPTKASSTPGLLSALEERKAAVTPLGEYAEDWYGLCSAYAPVFNRNGEIAAFSGVDIGDEQILEMRNKGRESLRREWLCIILVVAFGTYSLLKFRSQNRRLEKQSATLDANVKEIRYYNDNLRHMVDDKTRDVLRLQNAIVHGLADIVEGRDNYTGGHIVRTQDFLRELMGGLVEMGLHQEEMQGWDIDMMELMVESSQLHDVGKIFVPDGILKKPGRLSHEEFEEIKKHVQFGVNVIKRIESNVPGSDFLKYAKILVETHHEKWDGSGYPNGLAGHAIPLLGRLMAIVDVYDALTSRRPYKDPFPHEKAVEIIMGEKGRHFDPVLVEVFERMADRFVLLSSSAAGR